ncbi:DUF3488 and transglutaminase-like domain-containing protein [Lipingzhangella sp. LS1_29]|uniref:DUF3488 and transglutaminase-like domain-containing protein n=1 Tax=Lipingzhangella rawalii TaxID=2055835 RepID=A0ABU2H279_9ACTN|nr:DUF3488 and transglutaminase-like domain-containing protein [Lipingzhangella rawalii]MDS1269410.1 DUF3488 and transglutaminase-like domain-containing protein [Lipingzhangella rawalii]
MRVWATVAATLATLFALPLLHPLFVDSRWITGPAMVVATVGLVGALGRFISRPRLPAVAVLGLQLGAVVLVITVRHASETALLGFLPTPSTLRVLIELANEGRLDLYSGTAPVADTPGIELAVLLLVAAFALTMDLVTVVARTPTIAGGLLLALLLVPLSLHYTGVGTLTFVIAALGFVLLLAVEGRDRSRGWPVPPVRNPTATTSPPRRERPPHPTRPNASGRPDAHPGLTSQIAVLAVVAALLIPAAVPGLSSDAVFTLTDPRHAQTGTVTTTHPLVSLRRELLSPGEDEVLRYTNDAHQATYLRTAVLADFDGVDWTMAPVHAGRDRLLDEGSLPAPPDPWNTADPLQAEIRVADQARGLDFLPLPHPTSEVDIAGDWYVEPDTAVVFSPTTDASGSTYTLAAPRPDFDNTDLAQAREVSSTSVDDRYRALPADLTSDVTELTQEVVPLDAGPHERAVALQEWFTGGDFDYDLSPQSVPDGTDPLTHFLIDSRAGYCEQFAAAMAIMARVSDIPARVAVGYTGGSAVAGTDEWRVTQEHAHAWPELYFEGHGWLRFEPTPASADGQGSANIPDYATVPSPQDEASHNRGGDTAQDRAGGTGASDAQDGPIDEDLLEDQLTEGTAEPADDTGTDSDTAGALTWPVLATAVALLILGTAPALLGMLLRYLGRARASTPQERAHVAWQELRLDCQSLGVVWNSAESPRSLVRRLSQEFSLASWERDALERIAHAEEQARYAPTAPAPHTGTSGDLTACGRVVRAALRARTSWMRRLRSRLLPGPMAGLASRRYRSRAVPQHQGKSRGPRSA